LLNIAALEKLVHELSRLPGIGPKTAQRLAYYVLKSKDSYPHQLSEALLRVQTEVHSCSECFNYTDRTVCRYCEDSHRNNELLCVVEEPSDISRIESSGAFRGRYHVLHGVISPLDGVTAKDLKVAELIEKINEGLNGSRPQIKEIIFAFDADLEGDTTALYLTKVLQGKEVKISRIAHGIPMGSDIDFIDDRTMGRALENRVEL
jgi:recombination protein RecR